MGASRRYTVNDTGMIAGVRTGSPARKNDSSIFAHYTENQTYEREGLKRKDVNEIPKPRVVQNNLSASKQVSSFNNIYG